MDGHDPSAALAVDGILVAALEEERISGIRHHPGAAPRSAIAWLLRHHALKIDDIDILALGWDPNLQPDKPEPTDDADLTDWIIPPRLFPRRKRPQLLRVRHHLAHAMGAWSTMNYGPAAILVMDGSGELESVSTWRTTDHGLNQEESLPFQNSFGYFYQALTEFIGLGRYAEGKTTGLAPWGNLQYSLPGPLTGSRPKNTVWSPTGTVSLYREVIRGWKETFQRVVDAPPTSRPVSVDISTEQLRLGSPPHVQREGADLAASAQHVLEQDAVKLALSALNATSMPTLALSGGVALNCSMNGAIESAIYPAVLHVQPACNDAGVAVGAACMAAWQHDKPLIVPTNHIKSGPAYNEAVVADRLRQWGLSYSTPSDPAVAAQSILSKQDVLAIFDGAAEFGPRALGSRSILADASTVRMRDRVNVLKRRELWRPLGPSILQSHSAKYLQPPSPSLPFMLTARQTTAFAASESPAIVHVDGSTRAQTLNNNDECLLHDILEAKVRNGEHAVVINTSFNVDHPIVLTPEQAVRTYMTSSLDALLISGHLLKKRV